MVENLTKETFKAKVFDFEKNEDWKYIGDKPCIIDFYADWCAPCKTIAPILEELASEESSKMTVYKINVEDETELASIFSIRSIPSLLFVPMNEIPKMIQGANGKEQLKKIADELFV